LPEPNTILLVMLAGFALSATPGPSMLYVLSRTIGQNRAAGLASSVGLALGGLLLALATAAGLTAIFSISKPLYLSVQYLGAAYLIYLGVQMLIEEKKQSGIDQVQNQSFQKIVVQGIFVELLNPKTILFFLAFIPQFIDSNLGSVSSQMLVLGVLVPLTAFPSDIIVSFAGGTLSDRLSKNRRIGQVLYGLGGLFLIGLGIRTFFL
jgi:threonine/homoserine/homoserine lactone efflux protein